MSKDQRKQIDDAWKYYNLFYKAVHDTYKGIYKNATYGIDRYYDVDKMGQILPLFFNQSVTYISIDENSQFPRNVFENPVKRILCQAPNDLYNAFNAAIESEKWYLVSSKCIISLSKKNHWFCNNENIVQYLKFLKDNCKTIDNNQYQLDIKWIEPNHIKLYYHDTNSVSVLSNKTAKQHAVKGDSVSTSFSQDIHKYTAYYKNENEEGYKACIAIQEKNIWFRDALQKSDFIDQECKIGPNQVSTVAEVVCNPSKEAICDKLKLHECDQASASRDLVCLAHIDCYNIEETLCNSVSDYWI